MRNVLGFIDIVLAVYTWVVFATMVLYWLIGFGVLHVSSPAVAFTRNALSSITTPLLRPIRSVLPKFGVDVSSLLAILMIITLRYVLALYILPRLR